MTGEEGAGAAPYSIRRATGEDVEWLSRLEAELYSPRDAIPARVLREWYEANPYGFNILRRGEERIGHADILPLRPAPLRRILDGEIVERDIRGGDLYSTGERGLIRDLYVESVAVRPSPGSSRAPAVSFLVANAASLVERLCEPSGVNHVYAIAASAAGESLMRRLGFARMQHAGERVDKHELWGVTLSDLTKNLSTVLRRRGRGRAPR